MPRPYNRRLAAAVVAVSPTEAIPFADRSFGIEIELYGLDVNEAARSIVDIGIDCRVENYNHQTRTWWKAVTDVSIEDHNGNNFHRGGKTAEVVSPILSGEDGLETVRKVCRALSAAGAKVNKTTGLHVHIDARTFTGRTFAVIAKRYAMHEATIDSFMPASRRGATNRYCHSLLHNVARGNAMLLAAQNARDVYNVFGHRMFKVNYESFLRHGTVEFRHHSGSVNAEKVTNWIRFCQNFVSTSINIASADVVSPARSRRRRPRGETSTAEMRLAIEFAREIERSGGGENARLGDIRTDDIAARVGIARASVPAVVSKLRRLANIRIKKVSWNDSYYVAPGFVSMLLNYVGTANQAGDIASPAPLREVGFNIPENDTCFVGLDATVAGYYQERISDLAGA